MEYIYLVLGGLFAVIGLVGSIVPVLPGPPLAYVTLWMMWLYNSEEISISTLIVAGVIMIVITVLDYIAPVWLTKKGGGSKVGERGAIIGLIIGLFLGPLGIILGPFFGAVIAELIYDGSNSQRAFRSGLGSFLSFFVGTGIKLAISLWLTIIIFIDVFKNIF